MAKRRETRYPTPRWLRLGILLFIGYAVMVGYRGATEKDKPELQLDSYPQLKQFVSAKHWKRTINPGFGQSIDFDDKRVGNGDYAACGQTVELIVRETPKTTERMEAVDAQMPQESLRFVIGDDSVLPAWDRAVRGMRQGGIRIAQIGARLFDASLSDPDIPDIPVELELASLSPALPDNSDAFFAETTQEGVGKPVSCGEEAEFYLRVYNSKGDQLFTTEESDALKMIVGQGRYGHGIDRGIVGARPGETRSLTIPPAYLPQQSEVNFPKGEIAIVELRRVPYNPIPLSETEDPRPEAAEPEAEPEKTDIAKEPEHERDRKPSESH